MMPRHSPERRRHGSLSSPASAATGACAPLPEELIFDVLSRVPVKSACRFRCASRGWHALISDQAFLAAHRSRHAEPLLVTITSSPHHAGGGRDLRLMDMDGNVVRVTKGAGGLTLLSTSMDELVGVAEVSSSRVIDPATGEVLAYSSPKQVFGFYIMFGFGRAIPSGAYKMVRLVNNQTFEVFTLGDKNTRWRRSKLPPIRVNGCSQVTANGVMYFMVSRQLDDDGLLRFDLESEEWKPAIKGPPIASSPEEWWNDAQSVRIAELNGFLCVIQSEMQASTNVWLRADDSWIKAYSIPAAPSSYYYMPLRVTHDGGKLIFYCFFHGQGHLLRAYDPATNTCTTLRRLDDSTEKVGLCSLHLDRFVLNKI
ncbi:hypothetical protein VPH35_108888 [Triticum aestivum]|uniref:F-box domain-containing protein n=1 Tax=Triticum turgidum subsp. durum TaxID=4567 RepID=A0A9R0YEQ1_TRITD|nr:F-box protein At1g67130-like [Triticum aestivum]VAI54056.1 unnamed protein product [Triticum turgidum subsp. durum]